MIALASTNDLIAAEAQYHPSCYTDYTLPVTGKILVEKSDYQKLELETFHEVIKRCHDIICSPSIVKFEELLLIMKNLFLKKKRKKKKQFMNISQSTKKSLSRSIGKCFGNGLKFISVRRTLFLHPSVMSGEQVIIQFYEPKKDDYVAKAAAAIRKEVKCSKDEMPWLPQPSDFDPEIFKMPSKLNEFLTCLLTIKEEMKSAAKVLDSDIL